MSKFYTISPPVQYLYAQKNRTFYYLIVISALSPATVRMKGIAITGHIVNLTETTLKIFSRKIWIGAFMNKGHVKPAEAINLYSLHEDMPTDSTFALVKTPDMEVIRMVLPKGKEVPEHSVKGEISVQCLQGTVDFGVDGETTELQKGDWLYLNRHQSHFINAKADSVLLVTILFISDS